MAHDATMLITHAKSYEAVYYSFRWRIPKRYNMAHDVCDRHARDPRKTALIYFDENGREQRFRFLDIKRAANSLANALEAHDIAQGDRVAILLPQCPETAIAHVAAHKMGAVSLPLFTLFGEEALEYRLSNSGAKVVITNKENLRKVVALRDRLPDLALVIVVDAVRKGGGADLAFWPAINRASSRYRNKPTLSEDPAFLIYTSGTTGPPKGALHAHRSMIAHMPSLEFYHQFFPQPGDLFWSPADWAWIGGLMDNLMPAWFHGVPVLAFRARKFDPEEAFSMIEQHRVRNSFIPPTALKMMRQVPNPETKYRLSMRSMFSGGETLGEELLHWGYKTFGMVISEGYGQTECNLMVGNCPEIMDVIPGSMGCSVPGHRVGVVDDNGTELPRGTTGNLAFHMPDPIAMLRYWENEKATKNKYRGDWMMSGDLGVQDERGYFWFMGRSDDVITSAGYRIGPGEIEECLVKHPAVALAAAIGVPDKLRTEVVKAFIVPAKGHTGGDALAAEIQEYVKSRLSAHEYPRMIEFVDELPLTATGKIRRLDLRQMEAERAEAQAEARDAADTSEPG